MGVHEMAATGYQRAAGSYLSGRPSYPAAAVDWLVGRIGAGRPVLDVGAGAGAMSVLLAERGVAVVAVEPVEAMASGIPGQLARMRATAGELAVRDRSVGAVVAATAFHWFATPEALADFARVLVPGGVVGLVWNVRDESVPWVRAHTDIVEAHAAGTPRYASLEWERVVRGSELFSWEDEHLCPNPSPTNRQGLVERILSTSFIAALDDAARAKVEAQAWDLAAGLPENFEYPYLTRTVLLRRP